MEPGNRSNAYLVALRDVVVRADLTMTIADHAPGAVVIEVADATEALDALSGVDRVAVAFVECGPARFGDSALAALLEARGARIVLLGGDAEDAVTDWRWPSWGFLLRPFTSDTVKGFLVVP